MGEFDNVDIVPTPRRRARKASDNEETKVIDSPNIETLAEESVTEEPVKEEQTTENDQEESEKEVKKTVEDIFANQPMTEIVPESVETIGSDLAETSDAIDNENEVPIETVSATKDEIKAAVKSQKAKVLDQMSKGIKPATAEEKSVIYGDGDIVPLEDKLQFVSEGEKRRQEYLVLVNSYRTKATIKGTIMSGEDKMGTYCAVVRYGGFKIYIPADKLLSNTEIANIKEADSEKEKALRTRRMVHQRINSEIDFIISALDEKLKIAVGDRRTAMDIIKGSWYLSKVNGGKYAIEEGGKFEARIVSATRSLLVVEVHGIEYRLSAKDVSYVRVPSLEHEYPVGTTTTVIFTNVTRTKKEGRISVSAKVSIKEAHPDPRKEWFDDFDIGAMTIATVTGIDEKGIFVRLGGMEGKQDMVCEYPKMTLSPYRENELPYIGQKVMCKVTRKVEVEKDKPVYWMYGVIVRKY